MSTVRFQLSTGDFTQDWSTAAGLLSTDNWDLLPSIVGYRGDDLVGGTGADPRSITSAASSEGVVDYFSSASGNPSAGGVQFGDAGQPDHRAQRLRNR